MQSYPFSCNGPLMLREEFTFLSQNEMKLKQYLNKIYFTVRISDVNSQTENVSVLDPTPLIIRFWIKFVLI